MVSQESLKLSKCMKQDVQVEKVNECDAANDLVQQLIQKYSKPSRDVYRGTVDKLSQSYETSNEISVQEILDKYRYDGEENYSWIKQKQQLPPQTESLYERIRQKYLNVATDENESGSFDDYSRSSAVQDDQSFKDQKNRDPKLLRSDVSESVTSNKKVQSPFKIDAQRTQQLIVQSEQKLKTSNEEFCRLEDASDSVSEI